MKNLHFNVIMALDRAQQIFNKIDAATSSEECLRINLERISLKGIAKDIKKAYGETEQIKNLYARLTAAYYALKAKSGNIIDAEAEAIKAAGLAKAAYGRRAHLKEQAAKIAKAAESRKNKNTDIQARSSKIKELNEKINSHNNTIKEIELLKKQETTVAEEINRIHTQISITKHDLAIKIGALKVAKTDYGTNPEAATKDVELHLLIDRFNHYDDRVNENDELRNKLQQITNKRVALEQKLLNRLEKEKMEKQLKQLQTEQAEAQNYENKTQAMLKVAKQTEQEATYNFAVEKLIVSSEWNANRMAKAAEYQLTRINDLMLNAKLCKKMAVAEWNKLVKAVQQHANETAPRVNYERICQNLELAEQKLAKAEHIIKQGMPMLIELNKVSYIPHAPKEILTRYGLVENKIITRKKEKTTMLKAMKFVEYDEIVAKINAIRSDIDLYDINIEGKNEAKFDNLGFESMPSVSTTLRETEMIKNLNFKNEFASFTKIAHKECEMHKIIYEHLENIAIIGSNTSDIHEIQKAIADILQIIGTSYKYDTIAERKKSADICNMSQMFINNFENYIEFLKTGNIDLLNLSSERSAAEAVPYNVFGIKAVTKTGRIYSKPVSFRAAFNDTKAANDHTGTYFAFRTLFAPSKYDEITAKTAISWIARRLSYITNEEEVIDEIKLALKGKGFTAEEFVDKLTQAKAISTNEAQIEYLSTALTQALDPVKAGRAYAKNLFMTNCYYSDLRLNGENSSTRLNLYDAIKAVNEFEKLETAQAKAEFCHKYSTTESKLFNATALLRMVDTALSFFDLFVKEYKDIRTANTIQYVEYKKYVAPKDNQQYDLAQRDLEPDVKFYDDDPIKYTDTMSTKEFMGRLGHRVLRMLKLRVYTARFMDDLYIELVNSKDYKQAEKDYGYKATMQDIKEAFIAYLYNNNKLLLDQIKESSDIYDKTVKHFGMNTIISYSELIEYILYSNGRKTDQDAGTKEFQEVVKEYMRHNNEEEKALMNAELEECYRKVIKARGIENIPENCITLGILLQPAKQVNINLVKALVNYTPVGYRLTEEELEHVETFSVPEYEEYYQNILQKVRLTSDIDTTTTDKVLADKLGSIYEGKMTQGEMLMFIAKDNNIDGSMVKEYLNCFTDKVLDNTVSYRNLIFDGANIKAALKEMLDNYKNKLINKINDKLLTLKATDIKLIEETKTGLQKEAVVELNEYKQQLKKFLNVILTASADYDLYRTDGCWVLSNEILHKLTEQSMIEAEETNKEAVISTDTVFRYKLSTTIIPDIINNLVLIGTYEYSIQDIMNDGKKLIHKKGYLPVVNLVKECKEYPKPILNRTGEIIGSQEFFIERESKLFEKDAYVPANSLEQAIRFKAYAKSFEALAQANKDLSIQGLIALMQKLQTLAEKADKDHPLTMEDLNQLNNISSVDDTEFDEFSISDAGTIEEKEGPEEDSALSEEAEAEQAMAQDEELSAEDLAFLAEEF